MASLPRALILSLPLLLNGAVEAGGFSISPWTDDASSEIVAGKTAWAYRFGGVTATTINAVPVAGLAGPTASNLYVEVTGFTAAYNGDNNVLTDLSGTGSAIMAADFVYGGDPATIRVKGLTPGQIYALSFYSVGWLADQPRHQEFSSQTDLLEVNQDLHGEDHGLRVDYVFIADATTRVIDISPVIPANTFHLYGLALRQFSDPGPLVVSNGFDSGTGSLRQALLNAAATPGANNITFTPSFSGPVRLTGEITITDPGGVTVDATTTPGGITITGGDTTRLFTVSAGTTLTLTRLTLTGGNGSGGSGGAIVNLGDTTLDLCTVVDNQGSSGGAILCEAGTLRLTRCTLSGNHTAGAGSGGAIHCSTNLIVSRCLFTGNNASAGGAVRQQGGTATLEHCTFSGNAASFGGGLLNSSGVMNATHCTISGNSADVNGGGMMNNSGQLNLTHCIVFNNIAQPSQGRDIFNTGIVGPGTVTRVGANLHGPLVNEFTSTSSGPAPISTDPLLSPPADHGGPTQTMALQTGSPAINAATGSTATTDQRGYFLNGTADLGALEFGGVAPESLIVTHAGNAGDGSLRQALANAAAAPGPHTVTFVDGFTGPILLDGEILIDDTTGGVTVDAGGFEHGVTVHGNLASRVLQVSPGAIAILRRVNLVGGWVGGGYPSGYGGGVLVEGLVLLEECTLDGNTAFAGGAAFVANNGAATLTLRRCTISNNNADFGGGVQNEGTLSCISTTFAANNAAQQGGAVSAPFSHPATLDHCTLAYNAAGTGGGVVGDAITLQHSILSANFATTGPDYSGTLNASGSQVGGSAGLGPLMDCGGPTSTIPLRTGSIARDTATGSAATMDQRRFPIVGTPDRGAYEAGTLDVNFNAYIWETLPVTAGFLQHASFADYDGDGSNNQTEWIMGSNPAASVPRGAAGGPSFLSLTGVGGAFQAGVVSRYPGRTYVLQFNDTPGTDSWSDVPGLTALHGEGADTWSLSGPAAPARLYRLGVTKD
jgi:hypothetical protein